MIVWDRYLGSEVELPEVVENGRFHTLADTRMNGKVLLNSGHPILSYGEIKFRLNNDSGFFLDFALPGSETSDQLLTKSESPPVF